MFSRVCKLFLIFLILAGGVEDNSPRFIRLALCQGD